jgi:hypothetical protein
MALVRKNRLSAILLSAALALKTRCSSFDKQSLLVRLIMATGLVALTWTHSENGLAQSALSLHICHAEPIQGCTSNTSPAGEFRSVADGDIITGTGKNVFRVDTLGSVHFGSNTRQMINFFSTSYGTGVQNNALYQRTNGEFFWYRGGTHSDGFGEAGAGGTQLMRLGQTGNLQVSGDIETPGVANFGATTRQMINLFNNSYGIGVQNNAFYQRTGNEFLWYFGGAHSDAFGDAGGGTQLMRLGNSGTLLVSGRVETPTLKITGGADVAEPFAMSRKDIAKGAVVIIDEDNPGHLKLSDRAYDMRVAGIVSGANGVQAGISLNQQGVLDGGQNVALSGRVYVLADASNSPIKPGDLLTTAATPGHAMKVTDYAKAQGAILGKAMSGLKGGKGMVQVLVTLQ